MIALRAGALVEHNSVPGMGRVGAINGARVRIGCFESVAEPVVDSHWVDSAECNHVRLQREIRVYWQDPDTGVWWAGRNAKLSDLFARRTLRAGRTVVDFRGVQGRQVAPLLGA
jgi:hypothetical protein